MVLCSFAQNLQTNTMTVYSIILSDSYLESLPTGLLNLQTQLSHQVLPTMHKAEVINALSVIYNH
jgi:hypothetical protein